MRSGLGPIGALNAEGTRGTWRPSKRKPRHTGGGRYEDRTPAAGLRGAGTAYSFGAAADDYDNGGLLDLMVANYTIGRRVGCAALIRLVMNRRIYFDTLASG